MKLLEELWDGVTAGLIIGVVLTVILFAGLLLWGLRCLPGQADLEIDDIAIAPIKCTVGARSLTLHAPDQPGRALHLVDQGARGWRAEIIRSTGVVQLSVEQCSTLDVRMWQPGTEYASGKLVIDCPNVSGRVDLGACR